MRISSFMTLTTRTYKTTRLATITAETTRILDSFTFSTSVTTFTAATATSDSRCYSVYGSL
jgi:hypothetical protein